MSRMVISPSKLMIVERTIRGMSAEAYESRLEAVIAMIDNGAIGGGVGYGCAEHLDALNEVEKQVKRTRKWIGRQSKSEDMPDRGL